MTTQAIQSGSASQVAFVPSSQGHSLTFVSGTDGSSTVLTRPQPAAQAGSQPCVIYRVETVQDDSKAASFSEFDNFVDELEASPEDAAHLAAGRKWVASSFYGDKPTLASLRLAAGLSQRQLGEASGMDQPHVSRYESGKHEPGIEIAASLARALGITLEVFAQAWRNSREALQAADCK